MTKNGQKLAPNCPKSKKLPKMAQNGKYLVLLDVDGVDHVVLDGVGHGGWVFLPGQMVVDVLDPQDPGQLEAPFA